HRPPTTDYRPSLTPPVLTVTCVRGVSSFSRVNCIQMLWTPLCPSNQLRKFDHPQNLLPVDPPFLVSAMSRSSMVRDVLYAPFDHAGGRTRIALPSGLDARNARAVNNVISR